MQCATEFSGADTRQDRFKVVEASIGEVQVQGVGLDWLSAPARACPQHPLNSFAGPVGSGGGEVNLVEIG